MNYIPPSWLQRDRRGLRTDMLGFAAFAALLVSRIVHHAMWRDEAQAWLVAAHADSILDLLIIRGEGHPPLWYWILFLFSRIDQELWVLKVPTILFGVASLALLWRCGSLSVLQKVLVSGGFYLSFQYGVISRGYVAATFLLLLFAVELETWRRRPVLGGVVLGLAALTHVYFAFAAAALYMAAIICWGRSQGFIRRVVALGMPFALLAIYGGIVALRSLPTSLMHDVLSERANAAPGPFAPVQLVGAPFLVGFGTAVRSSAAVTLIGFAVMASACREPLKGAAFCLCILAMAFILPLTALSSSWLVGVFYLVFVGWLIMSPRQFVPGLVEALLAVSLAGGLRELVRDTTSDYASGAAAARAIAQSGEAHEDWVAFPDFTGTVTFAMLRRPYFSLECECDITFVDWNSRTPRLDADAIARRLAAYANHHPSSALRALVSTSYLSTFEAGAAMQFCIEEERHIGDSFVKDETFSLMRLHRRSVPGCDATTRAEPSGEVAR